MHDVIGELGQVVRMCVERGWADAAYIYARMLARHVDTEQRESFYRYARNN